MISLRATEDWPYQVGSGGVIFKIKNGTRYYALLIRRNYKFDKNNETFNLAKGSIEGGESLEQGAVREALEESGLETKPIAYLGALNHTFTLNSVEIDRTVHYYLLEFVGGDSSNMDDEHDELVWRSADEAVKLLSLEPKQEEEIIGRAEHWFKKFNDES